MDEKTHPAVGADLRVCLNNHEFHYPYTKRADLRVCPFSWLLSFVRADLRGLPLRVGFLLDSHKHRIVVGGEAALVAAEGDFLRGI